MTVGASWDIAVMCLVVAAHLSVGTTTMRLWSIGVRALPSAATQSTRQAWQGRHLKHSPLSLCGGAQRWKGQPRANNEWLEGTDGGRCHWRGGLHRVSKHCFLQRVPSPATANTEHLPSASGPSACLVSSLPSSSQAAQRHVLAIVNQPSSTKKVAIRRCLAKSTIPCLLTRALADHTKLCKCSARSVFG